MPLQLVLRGAGHFVLAFRPGSGEAHEVDMNTFLILSTRRHYKCPKSYALTLRFLE